MKHAIAALALAASMGAHADPGIITGNINGNKLAHIVGVAGLTFIGTDVTGDERYGLALGITASVIREAYKWNHPGYHASWYSIASDVAGLYLGHTMVKGLGIGATDDGRGLKVTYATQF